ncbi:DUF4397 domain-containing protein [Aliiglaciecola sp.]|nr:DUF4397 domain-containing protein [Aliiglaciecola sp.]
MKGFKSLLIIPLVTFGLVACNDDDDDPVTPVPIPEVLVSTLRIIHTSPDAPVVNVYANDAILAGLENVDYQVGSADIVIDEGDYAVRVEAVVPGGNLDVIDATLTFEGNTTYNVFAVDTVADGVEALIVSNADTAVTAGSARVQVVHAAPNAPAVDIYVTAPGADLAAEQPVATADYKDFTGQLEVPAGDYQIRITLAGMTDVVYDSGTVNLPDGADLVIAATQNVATGESPVTLLAIGATGASKIFDKNTGSSIRVVHAIADAPAVDVIANNALTLFDGPAFKVASDYVNVAADDYLIDVVVDADNSVIAIDDAEITLEEGRFYTAIANNVLASPDLDLLTDMPRAVATESRVRIIHSSPATGDVDIYVTADGEIADVDPTFAAVPYNTDVLAETGYVSLAAGDYVVSVTGAGSKDKAIDTGVLTLLAGGVYTAIAVDGDSVGDGPQLITLDDF